MGDQEWIGASTGGVAAANFETSLAPAAAIRATVVRRIRDGLLALCLALASQSAWAASQVSLYVESGIRHSARSVAFSADGRLIATGSLDRTVKIWDARAGRELATLVTPGRDTMAVSLAFLPGPGPGPGRLAALGEDGQIEVWDVIQGKPIGELLQCATHSSASLGVTRRAAELRCADPSTKVVRRWDLKTLRAISPGFAVARTFYGGRLSADGTMVSFFDDAGGGLVAVETGAALGGAANAVGLVEGFAVAPDGRRLATVRNGSETVQLWTRDGDKVTAGGEIGGARAHDVAFSPDGTRLAIAGEAGDVAVVDPTAKDPASAPLLRLTSYANRVEGAGLTPDSAKLAVHVWYDGQMGFDLWRGGIDPSVPRLMSENRYAFPSRGARYGEPFSIEAKLDRVEFRGGDDSLLATLVVLDKIGGWVVIDPKGRFDTNMDLGDIRGVHWTPAGHAMDPLPLDLLIKDYFEPRLLPRLLAGAPITEPPPLDTLNRAVPRVTLLSASAAGPTAAKVRVRVARGAGASAADARDLRLFRDGRLVARWPEAATAGPVTSLRRPVAESEIEVATPCQKAGATVRFTAFAFNRDGVKSETAALPPYRAPPCERPQRKAYVITIGVNSAEDPKWRLQYAVADAQAMAAALAEIGDYKVVPLSLTADGADWRTGQATKRNIRDVLFRLGGQPLAPNALAGVKGAGDLSKATPDDLVIVTFAGHGLSDRTGAFYLVPSDAGPSVGFRSESLTRLVSGQELSDWLGPIDAGQIALILDACRSTVSVDQAGFKPAPVTGGSLGVTAYYKAMRVLAAGYTSALESPDLKHGHMTYALVHDAFVSGAGGRLAADRDGDGRLTLAEWLDFAVRDTPALTAGEPNAQSPTFFDYAREPDSRVTLRPPAPL